MPLASSRASGARELRAVMVRPWSYSFPFRIDCAFPGIAGEAVSTRAARRKTHRLWSREADVFENGLFDMGFIVIVMIQAEA